MEISNKELKELKELARQYSSVANMMEYMQLYLDDPTKEYYRELLETIKFLSAELRHLRGGDLERVRIMTGDDKVFERCMMMLNNAEKIFASLEKGKSKQIAEENTDWTLPEIE